MKKILLLLAVLFSVAPLFAQGSEDFFIKPKSNAFYLGMKGGITMSSASQPDEGKLFDSYGMGYSGGLVLMERFGRASENSPSGTGYVAVGVELKYKQNKMKTLGYDENGDENADFSLTYEFLFTSIHL